MTLIFPLAVVVTVVMSALAECWLGLPYSQPGLSELHPSRGVG
jgi:hypothetical protein